MEVGTEPRSDIMINYCVVLHAPLYIMLSITHAMKSITCLFDNTLGKQAGLGHGEGIGHIGLQHGLHGSGCSKKTQNQVLL